MNLNKSQYRPDIDGLRALAVLAVLVFHIDPSLLPGGFLGVDVFFVISGFLITSIIAREVEAGEFSFVRFYERRIRRIVPALVMVLVATTVAAMVWWLPFELENYGKSMQRVMVGMSNVHFLNAFEDYFNDEARRAPLLHTWSLAVEEQYYFVFPVLVFGLFRGFKDWKPVVWILAGVFLFSLGLCVWRGFTSPMASFFLLPFRAWEMLIGSFLALSRFKASNEKTATGEGLAGMLLVLGSFAFLNEKQFAPGLSALPSCLGAALLLRSGGRAENIVAKVLSRKPLVFIGLISYSVYLWHWPLIVFAKSLWAGGSGVAMYAGLFAASVLLGWVSWRWIEQPFRRPQQVGKKSVWFFWGATTASFLILGSWIRHAEGLPERFPAQVRKLLECKDRSSKFKPENKKHFDPKRAPVYGDGSVTPSVALWGDSHAEALIPALDRLAKEYRKSFKYYGFPGQPPVSGMARVVDEMVEKKAVYTEKVLEEITGDKEVSVVVLHGRWSVANRGRNEVPGEEPLPIYNRTFDRSEDRDAYYLERIHYTIGKLLAAGKRVVFVGPVPEIGFDVPDFLVRQALDGESLASTAKCVDFERRHGYLLNALDSLKQQGGVTVILPHERLMAGNDVRISLDENSLYRDDDHLSEFGANYLENLWRPIFSRHPQSAY
jgi:peptidoglycan/LPS O-acetylase OafA/YrhL